MDGDTEVTLEPEDYPWAKDAEERRRSFVFENMANSEIDGAILIKNMQAVTEWLKAGEPRQRRLAAVSKDGD